MQMIFSGEGIGGCQVIVVQRVIRRALRGVLDKLRQRAGGDGFAQRRIVVAETCGEIDDAGIGDGAVLW